MLSFVFLLLFILKVVCLAGSANGECLSPPHISNDDLKSYQQDGRVSLLEEKPPFRFKPGEDTVHHDHELDCSAHFNSVGEEFCRLGIFPNPDNILNKNDNFNNSLNDEGWPQQLDTGGVGYGDRHVSQWNKPHNSINLKKHQFSKDREKADNSQNNLSKVQTNDLGKMSTYQETTANQKLKLYSANNTGCFISCFGVKERRQEVHSQPNPVKMKM